jgi:uracil-DNA glycosylase
VACSGFLNETFAMTDWKAILCLGSIGWNETAKQLKPHPRPKFGHGAEFQIPDGPVLMGSYHPSQQNTFTGRLTEEMLDTVMQRFADLIS